MRQREETDLKRRRKRQGRRMKDERDSKGKEVWTKHPSKCVRRVPCSFLIYRFISIVLSILFTLINLHKKYVLRILKIYSRNGKIIFT